MRIRLEIALIDVEKADRFELENGFDSIEDFMKGLDLSEAFVAFRTDNEDVRVFSVSRISKITVRPIPEEEIGELFK